MEYSSTLREYADAEIDPGLIPAPTLLEIAQHIDNQNRRIKELEIAKTIGIQACDLLRERIEELEAVIQKCINSMKGSNCLEEQWLTEALKG